MKLIEFSLRRRVTISMVAVALILFGLVAFGRLSINLLPDLSYPSLTVETKLPGAAPAEVEALLSRPIEELVGIVTGVKRLTSVSRPGLSQVTLEFEWGRDMDFAGLDVRQKLDLLRLPREASKPILLRFDPSNDPIVRLYLTGGRDLYLIAEYQHDGFGAASSDDLLGVVASAPFQRGELQVLGRDVAAVQASYQIDPLWGIDLLTITSLVDGSALLSGGVSWSVGPNSSLRSGFFLGIGDDTVDLNTGLGSEFGAQPNVGYLSLSHFF